MSLSVTPGASGASNTLALLQAFSKTGSPQATSPQAPSPQATSPVATTGASVSTGATTSATPGARSLFALVDGVGQALTTADAADAAGQGVIGLLQTLRTAAGQAAEPSASAEQRANLDQQFQAGLGQIASTLSAATVNGANLVDGSLASGVKVAVGEGASATLTPVDLSRGGPTLALPADASIATADGAASAFARLGSAIGGASAGLSTLQAQADQISAHVGFIQTLGQALASPTQDGGDSARLLALQVSQQLSAQPAAIANQSPESILSLFRS